MNNGVRLEHETQIPHPREEYEQRLRTVREELETSGLACLVVSSPDNAFYLTGYQTFASTPQFLVVGADGEPVFVLRDLEGLLADYTSHFHERRLYGDTEDPINVLAETIASMVRGDGRIGVEEESSNFSSVWKDQLQAKFGEAITNGSGLVESVRAVKSPREIELCRQAAVMTDAGMGAAVASVRPGATENDVAAAAAEALLRAGSEWFASSPVVTSGYRSGIPHTSHARRELEDGDSVLLEMSACFHRHFSPLMRSCVVGRAPDEAERMYQACKDGLEAAMAVIRPGITSGEAHHACQEVIDSYGYTDYFRKRLGYSVGIGLRSWAEGAVMDLKAGDERLLRPGMVFHMPPALRKPWEIGVGVSETIVVTETGCEPLGSLSRELNTK